MKDGSVVIAEKQISIKDETAPTVTIGNSSSTTNSISITVTATDGKETVQSATNSVRTYCPGTGLICNGPFTTTTTCSSCSGTGTSSSGYHVAKFRQTPTASYTEGRRCYLVEVTQKDVQMQLHVQIVIANLVYICVQVARQNLFQVKD